MGETASVSDNKEWNDRFGGGWQDFFRAYLLGRSYVGMRAEDVLVCARYLAGCVAQSAPREVHVIAIGETGPPVLHAVALEPACFASLRLEKSLRSWAEVVHAPLAKRQLMNAVHGALRVYDLPDLLSLLPKDKVVVKDPLVLAEEKDSPGATRPISPVLPARPARERPCWRRVSARARLEVLRQSSLWTRITGISRNSRRISAPCGISTSRKRSIASCCFSTCVRF
jgi:hypothetical protein